jgi:hypothetical protein
MAQTGYTPILLYGSTTSTNVPLAGNLTTSASGVEVAVNAADGKMFYKDSGGTVQVLATKGTGSIGGSNTQVQFNNSGVLGGSASLTWDGTYLTAGSIKDTALTSGRVTFAGASGLLSDASTLTWDGTFLTANSIKNTALTSGRVTFAGASGLLSDSANLTWSGTSFGVTGTVAVTGALTATLDSTFSSTGALLISKGTAGQQPGSPVTGMLRYNTTTSQFEGYSGASPAWNPVGGASLSNDTSTATNVYPLFANATSGTATTLYTGNANLLYKPSTGELQSRVPVASNGIVVNSLTVATSYTIAAGYSGSSTGPITVSSGAVVTVSSGSRWVVL